MIGRRPHALALVLGAASLCNSLPDDSAYTTPTFLWAEKKDMLIVTVLAFGSFAQVDFEDTAVRVALKPKEDGKQVCSTRALGKSNASSRGFQRLATTHA